MHFALVCKAHLLQSLPCLALAGRLGQSDASRRSEARGGALETVRSGVAAVPVAGMAEETSPRVRTL